MTNTELIEKARRDYPINTIVDSLGGNKNYTLCKPVDPYFIDNNKIRCRNNDVLFYYEDEWAKIISPAIPINLIESLIL